jgi:hypothetical protein
MSKSNLQQLLINRHYKKGYQPSEEQILFKIDGKKIGTRSNIVTLSGLAKAGKSTFLTSIMASAYVWDNQVHSISLSPDKDKCNIGYFDTESSEWDFYSNINRVQQQANIPELPISFNAFSCREDDPDTIKKMIELYLDSYPASIVIIDGVLDIMMDFNDPIESKKTIQWMKKITKQYDCLLIAVIHLARKESGLLGHFGSMLERYSQSVLEVIKDKDTKILELKPKFLRSDADFNTIALDRVNGQLVRCNPVPDKVIPITNKKGSK